MECLKFCSVLLGKLFWYCCLVVKKLIVCFLKLWYGMNKNKKNNIRNIRLVVKVLLCDKCEF